MEERGQLVRWPLREKKIDRERGKSDEDNETLRRFMAYTSLLRGKEKLLVNVWGSVCSSLGIDLYGTRPGLPGSYEDRTEPRTRETETEREREREGKKWSKKMVLESHRCETTTRVEFWWMKKLENSDHCGPCFTDHMDTIWDPKLSSRNK